MTRRTSKRRSSRRLRANRTPKISPTAERKLVEHVWASDSLDAAISDFDHAGTDELYLPGGELLRADVAAAVLRSWKPDLLPRGVPYITVYHATDRETADRLLREGVIPQLKPTNLAMLRHEAGEYAEFAPGRGISRGFYVANADIAKGFGRVLLELHVPESFITLPPEQRQDLQTALHNEDGAVITRPVPPSAIHEVIRKNSALQKKKQISPKLPYLFDLDPYALLFTERGQDDISEYVGDRYKPILVYESEEGDLFVLDGHHRTLIARKENKPVRGIVMPEHVYRTFVHEGVQQADMFREFARYVRRQADMRKLGLL